MLNKAIQKSINTLDILRIKLSEAETEGYSSKVVEALEKRVDRAYDSVAEVAKRQGFTKLTGFEFASETEIDVDTLNYLIAQ